MKKTEEGNWEKDGGERLRTKAEMSVTGVTR